MVDKSSALNQVDNKIEIAEDTIIQNDEFKKNVAIPYFKDIYKDLVQQSDEKNKGINKISFLTYAQLPSLIGERFFTVIDLNGDGFIELKEFVHGMFKVFYSNLETKLQLCFNMYDFNKDDIIQKEDVRLLMSHIPLNSQQNGGLSQEGLFTQDGGGAAIFLDRIKGQEEIQKLLDSCFGDDNKMTFEQFQEVNMEVSSEMFLAIFVLLNSSLPCAENFTRFKRNFEDFQPDISGDSNGQASPNSVGSNKSGQIKKIASPRLMGSLSPLSRMGLGSKFTNEATASMGNVNLNPDSQKMFLQAAANKKTGANEESKGQEGEDQELLTTNLPLSNNKAKVDRKNRLNELDNLIKSGLDKFQGDGQTMRLPNIVKKPALQINTGSNAPVQGDEMIQSPSNFLTQGASSPRLRTFNITEDEETQTLEGEMLRKADEKKIRRYWYTLLGKELYVYKSKNEDRHKSMHSLVGGFISDEPEEQLDQNTTLYPFKLSLPGQKARLYYLISIEDKIKWIEAIRKVIGYSNLFDYYEIKNTLGKGKFGLVKAAVHKKTGKKVAVKVMTKKDMTVQDMELQRREIEILKMCQHPHIIRLLDIFENQDFIYIVMECLSGGDLFNYLEKREFQIPEKRAKEISLQLASALYYLHSFGVTHRDLKPENILMDSNDDGACCKIVDFGLSKIIGPDEKATEPFGTLSYVAPEVLLQKPYGKEVDIWSLGVITYLLCSRVLPFDDDEDREIARQTIQDNPDFEFDPWTDPKQVSREAIEICKAMLQKNRAKRPSLSQIINMAWYDEVREKSALVDSSSSQQAGKQETHSSDDFKKYTLTGSSSPKIEQEIKMVQDMLQKATDE